MQRCVKRVGRRLFCVRDRVGFLLLMPDGVLRLLLFQGRLLSRRLPCLRKGQLLRKGTRLTISCLIPFRSGMRLRRRFLLFLGIVFLSCVLCLGVCFDMCFSGGCVSRVRVRGFWGVLWLVFCDWLNRILFLCLDGVGFLVLGISDFVVFWGLKWVMG